MNNRSIPSLPDLTPSGRLHTLVENRSIYTMEHCEMNVFETYQPSERVNLRFPDLVYTAMLRGKKVMHLFDNRQSFDYVPGESVIMPSNETMVIDFPEASFKTPAQCIALAIDERKIKETVEILNNQFAKTNEKDSWSLASDQFHIQNTQEISYTIDRIMRLARESNPGKDIFVNMAIQELLLRLMQTQARGLIFGHYKLLSSSNRFARVVEFVKENLDQNLTVEKLSDLACMSKPHFFRSFKREFGLSPVEFIIRERITKARELLQESKNSVSDVCFRLGFQSVNYFCTLFKKHVGVSPGRFKQGALVAACTYD
ncbi:AraC family transcriptional regulator [Ravibacter arvi]